MKAPAAAAPRPPPMQVYQPPPPGFSGYGNYGIGLDQFVEPPRKWQRVEAAVVNGGGHGREGIDTLAVLGAVEKGYTEAQLEDYFTQLPGFVAFKASNKVGGGFVKFISPDAASDALAVVSTSGLEVQWARSSME